MEDALIRQSADKLKREGYCTIANVLDNDTLQILRQHFSPTQLSNIPDKNFGESGGFVAADYRSKDIVTLLCWPKTLATLASFGFTQPKLHNFYVSIKQPHSQALPWHSDLFYEYDGTEPSELFLIYYLDDTTTANGCLRVLPGSHAWTHAQREQASDTVVKHDDEVDVPIKAGDLFIGDRRILHATHANDTDAWRTCITIAYAPNFENLDEAIKALIVQNPCLPPTGWWKDSTLDIDPRLAEILPRYEGSATPIALAS